MSTVEIETGTYIKRFAFWNPATWSIPKLYWDAWSQEQRLHAICRQLEKVIKYADYLGVNVDDIAARLKAIEEGQLDPVIEAAIEAWFEEHEPEILAAVENLQEQIGTGFTEENSISSVIGEGFSSENSIANVIANIESVIGTGFDNVETVAKTAETKGNGTLCATNYLGSLFHPVNDATLGRMHCGSIASNGSYQVVISTPFEVATSNMGKVEFISIENNEKNVFDEKYALLGHANSVTYDPNNDVFIVAPLYNYETSTAVLWNVLFFYDPTFSTYTSIQTDVTISAVSYDYIADKIYCFGIDDKLYELVDDELVYVNDTNVREEEQGLHVQDLAVYNGIWYISNTQGNIACGIVGKNGVRNIFDIAKQDTFQLFTLFGEVDGMDFTENGNLICTGDQPILSSGYVFTIFEIITPETKQQMFYLYHPQIMMTSMSVTQSSNALRETMTSLSTFNAANLMNTMIGDVVRFNLTEDYNAPDETITLNGFSKAIINLNGHDLTIDQIRFDSCELVIWGSGTLTLRRFYAPTSEMVRISLQNNVTIETLTLDATPFSSVSRTGSQLNCGAITNSDGITFAGNEIRSGRVYIAGTEILMNAG